MCSRAVSLSTLLLLCVSSSLAIICYENDEHGNVVEVNNEEWGYCVLVPKGPTTPGRLFGVGSMEDTMATYDRTFQQSDSMYKILTVCLYEKYDLSKLSPKFGKPEFLFRCVCNYDRCNSHDTFQDFLDGVHQDNIDKK